MLLDDVIFLDVTLPDEVILYIQLFIIYLSKYISHMNDVKFNFVELSNLIDRMIEKKKWSMKYNVYPYGEQNSNQQNR